MAITAEIIKPKWIEKYSANEGGRDFLGYEYSGALMLEKLMPGISNITYRIRYYSFFCWIIDQFLKNNDLAKTEKNFNRFLKEQSLIFLVANGLINADRPGTGIDGIEMARNILNANKNSKDIVISKEYIASYRTNYWIYRQKMAQLGLTVYNEENVESLTLGRGKTLAEHFDKAISGTKYYKEMQDNHFGDGSITLNKEMLLELGKVANFLDLVSHTDERNLLKKLLLDYEVNVGVNDNYQGIFIDNKNTGTPKARHESLKLYLKFINDTNLRINEKAVREVQYFSPLSPVYGFSPGDKLNDVTKTWQIFQARQYFVFAIESIFRAITSITMDNPMPLEGLMKGLIGGVNESKIEEFFGTSLDFNQSVESALKKISGVVGKDFNKNVVFDSKVNEEKIYEKIRQHNTEIDISYSFGFSIFQLLYLYLRFCESRSGIYWEFAKTIDRDGYLSLDVFMDEIERNKQTNLEEFLAQFIKKYIINRHIQIALEKFSAYRNDTFHLSYDEGKVLSCKHAIAVLNASKLQNIINTLNDLGLIKKDGDQYSVTKDGMAVINE